MKGEKQFTPVETLISGRRQFDNDRLERLNRARLDALGDMLQASHWLDEVTETARDVYKSLTTAEAMLRRRQVALNKADRAFFAYLERESAR